MELNVLSSASRGRHDAVILAFKDDSMLSTGIEVIEAFDIPDGGLSLIDKISMQVRPFRVVKDVYGDIYIVKIEWKPRTSLQRTS